MAEARIVATYAVEASATHALRLDTTGMDPDMIALYLQEDTAVDVTPCHECGRTLSNPEVVGLGGFMVDGVEYRRDEETGHWVVADADALDGRRGAAEVE